MILIRQINKAAIIIMMIKMKKMMMNVYLEMNSKKRMENIEIVITLNK